jgi:hypothetical protein
MQILRSFRRRFGPTSKRVAVRTHLPWYSRWALAAAGAAVLAGGGWLVYGYLTEIDGVRRASLQQALSELRTRAAQSEAENEKLRAAAAALERQLQIERATREDLSRQIQALADEAASARDEAAVLQSLLARQGKAPAVGINRFRVQRENDSGQYRYRLTLVQMGGAAGEFQGALRFAIHFVHDGKPGTLQLPAESDGSSRYIALSFKLFQPVEGTFRIPPGARLRSVEVRVFERGSTQPRLTQTAVIS